jgi:hypothetical protein
MNVKMQILSTKSIPHVSGPTNSTVNKGKYLKINENKIKVLEMKSQLTDIKNQKSKIKNQKSKIKNQKSKIKNQQKMKKL